MRVRMTSGVKRVTVLRPSAVRTDSSTRVVHDRRDSDGRERLKFVVIGHDGSISRGEVRLDLGGIRKQSRLARQVDKRLRKLVRSERRALDRYLVLHDQSSRRKRAGWLKDLPRNMVKVIRRS